MTASTNSPSPTSLLERRSELRVSPEWAQDAARDPTTRYLVTRGTSHLVRPEPAAQIAFLTADHPVIAKRPESELTLLGWYQGHRVVLVDLPADVELRPPGTEYQETRPLLGLLSPGEIELLILARALVVWRSRHRHCGVCGAPTRARSAGHVMRCTNSACHAEVFPRIDPAMIVLVADGDYVLLGRQKSWPAGRYSTLAGFVEPGESLEQTVVREVEEETGTHVTWTRYLASQAWPFPASLMIGFHAGATRGPVRLDGELEDARWFAREELTSGGPLLLPPPFTIARRLIEAWMREPTRIPP